MLLIFAAAAAPLMISLYADYAAATAMPPPLFAAIIYDADVLPRMFVIRASVLRH